MPKQEPKKEESPEVKQENTQVKDMLEKYQ